MKQKPLIFSTEQYSNLQQSLFKELHSELGLLERENFSDGEKYHRIISEVKDRDIVLIGGTITDSDIMELYELSCAFVKYGARTLNLVIPYYGYSTMERAIKNGEVVKAKTRARMLSFIPKAYLGNTIYLLDLHAENINHYFEGDTHCFHLSSKSLIIEHIKNKKLSNYVIASTDAGRAKDVQKMANLLQADIALIIKKREGEQTQAVAVSADVAGKHVIIYDDMIRSGGSMVEAIKTYQKAGAASIEVITVHGVFCSNAVSKIKATGVTEITCTNSFPSINYVENEVTVLDITSVLSSLSFKS